MTSELLPCPFCGSKPIHHTNLSGFVFIYCGNPTIGACHAQQNPVPPTVHSDRAIELWNRRSTAARVRNEALEEAAKVADARGWGPHIRDHSDSHAEGWRDCADEIAAKIRALQATRETGDKAAE